MRSASPPPSVSTTKPIKSKKKTPAAKPDKYSKWKPSLDFWLDSVIEPEEVERMLAPVESKTAPEPEEIIPIFSGIDKAKIRSRQRKKAIQALEWKQDDRSREKKIKQARSVTFEEPSVGLLDSSARKLDRIKNDAHTRGTSSLHPNAIKRMMKKEETAKKRLEAQDFRTLARLKRETKKIRKEILFSTESGDLFPVVGFNITDSVIKAYLASVLDSSLLDIGILSDLVSFGVMIYQIYNSSSVSAALAASYQWVRTLSSDIRQSVVDFASTALATAIPEIVRLYAQFTTESSLLSCADAISYLDTLAQRVVSSDIMSILRRCLFGVIACKWLSPQMLDILPAFFGKYKECSLSEMLWQLLKDIGLVFKYAGLIAEGVPLTEVLLADDPVTQLSHSTRDIMYYSDKTYKGLPVEGRMCLKEYIVQVNKLLTTAEALAAKVTKGPQSIDIRKNRDILKNASYEAMRDLSLSARRTPVGVIVSGDPGVGKSKIVPYTCKLASYVKGREYHECDTYTRVDTSDYFEGLDPPVHKILLYSEVGRFSAEVIKNKIDVFVSEACSMLDSLSRPVDMAFGEKGKTFAAFDLVIADTNFPDLNLKKQIRGTSAFERRFIYVSVVVRPEFRKVGSTSIDSNKVFESGCDPMDVWLFTVTTYEATSSVTSNKKFHVVDGNMTQYTTCMIRLMRDHFEKEDRVFESCGVSGVNPSDYFDRNLTDGLIPVDVEDGDGDIHCEAGPEIRSYSPQSLHHYHPNRWDNSIGRLRSGLLKGYFIAHQITLFMLFCFVSPLEGKVEDYVFLVCYTLLLRRLTVIFPSMFLILPLYIAFTYVRYRQVYRNLFRAYSISQRFRKTKLTITNAAQAKWETFSLFDWKYSMMLTCVVAISALIYKRFGSSFKTQRIPNHSDVENYVADMHSETSTSEESSKDEGIPPAPFSDGYVRLRNKLNADVWTSMIQPTPITAHKGGLDEFSMIAKRNTRLVKLFFDGTYRTQFIFGICENFALINKHALDGRVSIRVDISPRHIVNERDTTRWEPTYITPCNSYDMGNDMLLIRCSNSRFKDIRAHLPTAICSVVKDAKIGDEMTRATLMPKALLINNAFADVHLDKYWIYKNDSHYEGLCGTPLLVYMNQGCVIGGIHMGASTNASIGVSTVIDCDMITSALDEVRSRTKSMLAPSFEDFKHETGFPVPKSLVFYENSDAIHYLGKLPGSVMINQTSRVAKTELHSEIVPLFDKYGMDCTKRFAPPVLRPVIRNNEYISPWNINFRNFNIQKGCVRPEVVEQAVSVFANKIIENLAKEGVSKLSPFSMSDAINGVRGDEFMKGINMSTGAGFGYEGKKRDHFVMINGLWEPSERLRGDVNSILRDYASGKCLGSIYVNKLKDESRTEDKVEAGKTRLFSMTSLPMLIVSRMLLGPLYTLMCEHSDAFYSGVGSNMHRDAHRIYYRMKDFSTRIMEGDFKAYDFSLPPQVRMAANAVVSKVLEALGYTPSALIILETLLLDLLCPIVILLLDVFQTFGHQPSGMYGTAENNCLICTLLLMFFWYSNPDTSEFDFFLYNLPITYGDDLLNSVKDEVSKYMNNCTYRDWLLIQLGITYTASDKSDNMAPFLTPRRMSFLKRTFKFSETLDRVVAPLDTNSIARSLMWQIPSVCITNAEQVAQTIVSACWEVFFHLDRDTYSAFVSDIRVMANRVQIFPQVPSFDELVSTLT